MAVMMMICPKKFLSDPFVFPFSFFLLLSVGLMVLSFLVGFLYTCEGDTCMDGGKDGA